MLLALGYSLWRVILSEGDARVEEPAGCSKWHSHNEVFSRLFDQR
jgi:hypothetical protein